MFGGLAAQVAQLGTRLSIDTTENVTTAMAYDKVMRTAIETNSRRRISGARRKKLITSHTEEHDSTKKAALRDIAAATAPKIPKKCH